MPEVEDDMNVKIAISSDAPKLSSARIQLKLEAFQLGSARAIFGTARFAKIWPNQAICRL